MTEPITQLSVQLQGVVLQVLQQFGVPLVLKRTITIPSDRTAPSVRTESYLCRGAPSTVKRQYDKGTQAMRRVSTFVLSDPGVEPRADDLLLRADGSVAFVITSDTAIDAIRPDGVTTVAYECSTRTT